MKTNKCHKCGRVWHCRATICTYPKNDCQCETCEPFCASPDCEAITEPKERVIFT